MLQFQGIPALPWILPSSPYHKQPTPSTKQWICWSFGGHFEEVDGKVHQRWETVELWTDAVSCNTSFQHHPIPSWSPHRQKTEDFTSSDPFDHWEVCEKFQDLPGTNQMSTALQYFHQQLQHGSQTRTACFHQGSTRKCLEDRNHRSASQGARFLLGEVSRWFHSEEDPPDDQGQVIAFSFWVGKCSQGEGLNRIYPLRCVQQFPVNAPSTGANSLTDRQSGYTRDEWTCGTTHKERHSYQFPWCDTTFHTREEKQLFYQRCSTKEILSIQDLIPVVLCCGTQWKVFWFQKVISQDWLFCFLQLTVWWSLNRYSNSVCALEIN